jgi:stage IV sporulation protein FB
MLGAPETPYDLRFRLLDIPVRVHPLFWVISAVMGWEPHNLPMVAFWVACVFFSVLVHEYGHGLMSMRFHTSPSILLYSMGGLCETKSGRMTPSQYLLVLIAGPGAGFVLCFLVMLLASVIFGITPIEHFSIAETLVGIHPHVDDYFEAKRKFGTETNFEVYRMLVWINLMWGLVNLLPIWPLDGGQASQIILTKVNPAQGARWSHIVSLLLAGVLALLALAVSHGSRDLFLPIFFALFAFINFQALQTIHQAQTYGLYQDDDWWKR